jgi:hypothetical protein
VHLGDLKYRGYINTTIPLIQLEQIRKLSKKTNIPMSRLLEESLNDLLIKYHVNSPLPDKR